ncbi:MAG: hypothetical protein J6L83_09875 [Clostridia bacterium]|nr:hypothetical protein [Clostridia bacterium]
MKRIISLLLAVFVLISVFVLSSCSGSAPKLEDVKERFIYLIENSKELNTVYFGKGLPVYDRDGTLAEEKGVYYNDELTAYNKVMEKSRFLTVDEIKTRSREIYSSEYLSALYETAFDGVMTGSSSAYLRFYESEDWLYQNIYATDFELSERIYDYSSMQIVKPSNNEYINITIDTYTLDDKNVKNISLTFVYERGNWYLDSPTY